MSGTVGSVIAALKLNPMEVALGDFETTSRSVLSLLEENSETLSGEAFSAPP